VIILSRNLSVSNKQLLLVIVLPLDSHRNNCFHLNRGVKEVGVSDREERVVLCIVETDLLVDVPARLLYLVELVACDRTRLGSLNHLRGTTPIVTLYIIYHLGHLLQPFKELKVFINDVRDPQVVVS